jgi:hypothetical protein
MEREELKLDLEEDFDSARKIDTERSFTDLVQNKELPTLNLLGEVDLRTYNKPLERSNKKLPDKSDIS